VTLPRFYAPDLDPAATSVTLAEDESHHLQRVMRLGTGDEVAIFDGRGTAVRGRIAHVDRRRVSVAVVERLPDDAAPRTPISLVQSAIKGDRMDDVVRDATMAGAARIAPIVSERSAAGLAALERAHAHERWLRVAIASAKQCGRARLPVIDAPRTFQAWLDSPPDGLRLLLVEPRTDATPARTLRDALDGPPPPAITCVVGPEGGWSASERANAERAGCLPITLGSATLRADAAGLVAVSIVAFVVEGLSSV
jgi:16S rRNA (uracil1498-N3)-methyltransferase